MPSNAKLTLDVDTKQLEKGEKVNKAITAEKAKQAAIDRKAARDAENEIRRLSNLNRRLGGAGFGQAVTYGGRATPISTGQRFPSPMRPDSFDSPFAAQQRLNGIRASQESARSDFRMGIAETAGHVAAGQFGMAAKSAGQAMVSRAVAGGSDTASAEATAAKLALLGTALGATVAVVSSFTNALQHSNDVMAGVRGATGGLTQSNLDFVARGGSPEAYKKMVQAIGLTDAQKQEAGAAMAKQAAFLSTPDMVSAVDTSSATGGSLSVSSLLAAKRGYPGAQSENAAAYFSAAGLGDVSGNIGQDLAAFGNAYKTTIGNPKASARLQKLQEGFSRAINGSDTTNALGIISQNVGTGMTETMAQRLYQSQVTNAGYQTTQSPAGTKLLAQDLTKQLTDINAAGVDSNMGRFLLTNPVTRFARDATLNSSDMSGARENALSIVLEQTAQMFNKLSRDVKSNSGGRPTMDAGMDNK